MANINIAMQLLRSVRPLRKSAGGRVDVGGLHVGRVAYCSSTVPTVRPDEPSWRPPSATFFSQHARAAVLEARTSRRTRPLFGLSIADCVGSVTGRAFS